MNKKMLMLLLITTTLFSSTIVKAESIEFENLTDSIDMGETSSRETDKDIKGCYNYVAKEDVELGCHTRGGVAVGGECITNNDVDGGIVKLDNVDEFEDYWDGVAKEKNAIVITQEDADKLSYNYSNENIASKLGCDGSDSEVRVGDIPMYYYNGEFLTWNGVYGLLIAPHSNVEIGWSNACGTVVAKNIKSNAEYHLWDYETKTVEPSTEIPSVEPSTEQPSVEVPTVEPSTEVPSVEPSTTEIVTVEPRTEVPTTEIVTIELSTKEPITYVPTVELEPSTVPMTIAIVENSECSTVEIEDEDAPLDSVPKTGDTSNIYLLIVSIGMFISSHIIKKL